MGINYKCSVTVFGAIMAILGFTMLLPLLVAFVYHDVAGMVAFGLVAAPCILTGTLLVKATYRSSHKLKIRDGAFIVSVSWIMCSIIGSFPFIISGAIPDFVDAFFETASGFTTTGATILENTESLPRAMLFWRTFTQWLGGMGILQFTIALLPTLGMEGQQVAMAESTGPALSKITPKLSDTARYIYYMYITLTVAEIILLKVGGMSFFDSVCHSFSTISTGGFSNYNDSIGHFNSGFIEIVIMIFMLLAGMNFNLFFMYFRSGLKAFFKDEEWKAYAFTILGSVAMIIIVLVFNGTYDAGHSVRAAAFQDISLITTTGFRTEDYTLWPYFAQMMLFIMILIGGSTSSASGGIRIMRIIVLMKLLKKNIAVRLHPNAVIQVRINERLLTRDTVAGITNFVFIYLGIGLFAGFLISFDGYDFLSSISAAFSCLGNAGPALGAFGPGETFASLSVFSKLVCSFVMIAGRLEIFTLLMLFTRKFWNPNHQ